MPNMRLYTWCSMCTWSHILPWSRGSLTVLVTVRNLHVYLPNVKATDFMSNCMLNVWYYAVPVAKMCFVSKYMCGARSRTQDPLFDRRRTTVIGVSCGSSSHSFVI